MFDSLTLLELILGSAPILGGIGIWAYKTWVKPKIQLSVSWFINPPNEIYPVKPKEGKLCWLFFWNSGREPIRGTDFTTKPNVEVHSGLISHRPLWYSKPDQDVSTTDFPSSHSYSYVELDFDFLAPGDGITVELVTVNEMRSVKIHGALPGPTRKTIRSLGHASLSAVQSNEWLELIGSHHMWDAPWKQRLIHPTRIRRSILFLRLAVGLWSICCITFAMFSPDKNAWIAFFLFMIIGLPYITVVATRAAITLWRERRRFPLDILPADYNYGNFHHRR